MNLLRGLIGRRLGPLSSPSAIMFICHSIVAGLAATAMRLQLGPQVTSTAAMMVAIVALATAVARGSEIDRATAGQPADRPAQVGTFAAQAGTGKAEPADAPGSAIRAGEVVTAEALIADALAVARSAHDDPDAPPSPAKKSTTVGDPGHRPRQRWMRVDTAARRSGMAVEEIEALTATGRIAHRAGRTGTMLIDFGQLEIASGVMPAIRDTAGAAVAAAAAAVENGRAHMDVTAIAMLPSRKPAGVDGRLILTDVDGTPIALPGDLEPDLRARHDLMALAFAAATIQSRPPGTGQRPMFVRLATSSLLSEEFQDELEALCDDEPAVSAQLVLCLPPDAFGTARTATAIDALADRGVRFAADCPADRSLTEVLARLGRQTDCAFALATTAKFIDAPTAAAAFARIGIRPIAVEVTTEREVVELIDLGVEWALGPLLASSKPAPVHLAAAQAA